jgi:hypothetical protein
MINHCYTLEFFNMTIFNGFNYQMPEETMNIISELALEVGAPSYVKTPVFKKNENRQAPPKDSGSLHNSFELKKKKGKKSMEINNDAEWNNMTSPDSFQATKMEKNKGIDAEINTLRTYLNKLTDKNYNEYKIKVLELIEKIQGQNHSFEELFKVSITVFEIASMNRFYSKMYADLYTVIISNFEFMREPFDNCMNDFLRLFDVIEYVDPNVDYDQFCKINKDNEKRKSLSAFFINLMDTKIIPSSQIVSITRKLVDTIYRYISMENKKNEVDELSENVAILYKKKIYADEQEVGVCTYDKIDDMTITEVIEKIATSNVREYPSLTKKTIFKFMDLMEM